MGTLNAMVGWLYAKAVRLLGQGSLAAFSYLIVQPFCC